MKTEFANDMFFANWPISLKWWGAWAVAAKMGLKQIQNIISELFQLVEMAGSGYFGKSFFHLTWN